MFHFAYYIFLDLIATLFFKKCWENEALKQIPGKGLFSVTLQTRFCWNAYKYCIHHWVDITGNGFNFLSIQKCFLKMACSLPLYNGVIMHIKNLKDAIKTKTKKSQT